MLLPLHNQRRPPLHSTTSSDLTNRPFPTVKTLIIPKTKRANAFVSVTASDDRTAPDSAIQRIAEKLRSLGFAEDTAESRNSSSGDKQTTAGEIFVPLPQQLPKFRVGHTIDKSWSTPEFPVPEPGTGKAIWRYNELRKEWKIEREEEKKKRERVPNLAELSLAPPELQRLRTIGIRLNKKIKVGKAGITEGIVNGIHERWRSSEVVKIVCEDICGMNMKRTHDVLERKTGGLVIWRSGQKILLYRGPSYKYPYFLPDNISALESYLDDAEAAETIPSSEKYKPGLIQGVGFPGKVRFQLPGEAQMLQEAENLLDGLGPRFTDWWGYEPLPVDADLLPAIIHGYRRPYRLLPYGVSPKLTNDEMTTLRRLGRPLPCHFALGRNRKLQGLAAAIVKLWEKCEIVKIAVKRGVQNTNSLMMAEELKWLTGGTLIARDTDFIVLYRGKDFLPSAVSSVIGERRKHVMLMEKKNANPVELKRNQVEHRLDSVENTRDKPGIGRESDNTGPFVHKPSRSLEVAIEEASIKLSKALEKKAMAEKFLYELEKKETPTQTDVDKEGITEEERFMLRKVGLRMKPFLLLGVRGIFAGTIENMHLHWKFRELVKIISKEKDIDDAYRVAKALEEESGGILVAVETVSKGYAIIVYRGKNYQRPSNLRPTTLLSKREALKRSVEAQRKKSLKLNVLKLTQSIETLNKQMVEGNMMNSGELDDQSKAESFLERLGSTQLKEVDQGIGAKLQEATLADDETCKHEVGSSCEPDNLEPDSSACARTSSSEPADAMSHLSKPTPKGPSSVGFRSVQCGFESTSLRMEFLAPVKCKSGNSADAAPENVSNRINSSAINLSNKERLVLRKQALKMKKRPSFAVGKSNAVFGLGKAIKAHFEKHPLAIVNVKGRAKGTPVQEVVLKLKEATGGVLVSQEPSKVILYRGYGAETEHGHDAQKGRVSTRSSSSMNDRVQAPVSLELIEAIKLECGLLDHQNDR